MLYTVTPELLDQLADDNLDFYVRFYADEAPKLNFMILRIIGWRADHAGKYSRQEASAGSGAGTRDDSVAGTKPECHQSRRAFERATHQTHDLDRRRRARGQAVGTGTFRNDGDRAERPSHGSRGFRRWRSSGRDV